MFPTSMKVSFAAGLFDSPWVIAAIVIGSALVNWLSKRRQAKQSPQPSEAEEPSPTAKPAGEFNLEETLRRLLGEETPPPAPPLISRPIQRELSPASTRPATSPPVPILRPPVVIPPLSVMSRRANQPEEQIAPRLELLQAPESHPATVISHGRSRPLRWRNARSVRRAFVASLIFAPPKCFEP